VSESINVDTTQHTLTLRRRQDIDGNGNAGVEALFDGTSLGAATDTFVPDMTTKTEWRLWNQLDVPVSIENAIIHKPVADAP
jgi:hypothetical protein